MHVWLAMLFVIASCGGASIYQRNGLVLDAEIVGGDSQLVLARDDSGRIHALRRSEIDDIVHPGVPGMVLGFTMTTIGGSLVIWQTVESASSRTNSPRNIPQIVGFAGSATILGLLIALTSLAQNRRSKSKAEQGKTAHLSGGVVTQGRRTYYVVKTNVEF